MGAKRNFDYLNRKFWTQEESDLLLQNAHLSIKDLMVLFPGKSEAAVDQRRRTLLGSNKGKTRLKEGWDAPSIELAYVLGVLASDGCIGKYSVCLTQKKSNIEMFDKFVQYASILFGRRVTVKDVKRSWKWAGKVNEDFYKQAVFCSKEFYDYFGVDKVKAGEEWIGLVKKFSWVEEEKYFWYFIGGLYDGDGCLARKNASGSTKYEASIAVKPLESKVWLSEQLLKRGFEVSISSTIVKVSGGIEKVDGFLDKVQCFIRRKKHKEEVVSNERFVERIEFSLAEEFIRGYHYLETLPVGTVSYGLFIGGPGGLLVGVASYGNAPAGTVLFGNDGHKIGELCRLVLSDDASNLTDKSLLIGRSLKLYKQLRPELLMVLTYADISVGHEGRVYLAANGRYIGETGKEIGWKFPDGRVISGRHIDSSILKDGAEPIELPGKKRYCFILKRGGLGKKIIIQLDKKYG